MKGNTSQSNDDTTALAAEVQVVHTRQHRLATYQKVLDERKHPIPPRVCLASRKLLIVAALVKARISPPIHIGGYGRQ